MERDNVTTESLNEAVQYNGVRKRKWGKWVSEIREPGKKSRIWLGSFESPEMAAVAHDVAELKLKGHKAKLNFPEAVDQYPLPKSSKAEDIRSAALEAASLVRGIGYVKPVKTSSVSALNDDIEFGFESPKMWAELAQALLVEPPPMMFWSSSEVEVMDEWVDQGTGLWDFLM